MKNLCEEVHFSKFAGLRASTRQLYQEIYSFNSDLNPPWSPIKFWRAPPHVLNTCGKAWIQILSWFVYCNWVLGATVRSQQGPVFAIPDRKQCNTGGELLSNILEIKSTIKLIID